LTLDEISNFLLVALLLFATEAMSVDIITMLLLIVLVMAGILTPSESFAGFSKVTRGVSLGRESGAARHEETD
jgi:di/tricarboxylate transporter